MDWEQEPAERNRIRVWLSAVTSRVRDVKWLRRSVTLSPRALWLLIILIVGNLLVLGLIGSALYRTSQALMERPPEVTVVTTPTPAPTSTPAPTATPLGSGGAIAFTQRHNGNSDIYAINQTTREVVRLTSDPAEDRDPAWSPDGTMLAFTSRRGSNWDVYLLDLESGSLIRLTRDPGFDGNPTWSPDGTRIAFESYRNGNLDIYVMDATGRNTQRLTSDPAPEFSPTWSPDDSAIAFITFRDDNHDIYLYLLHEDEENTVINATNSPGVDESDPSWSPDGTKLAYTIGRESYSTVQISELAWRFTEAEPVLNLYSTELFGSGSNPAWSPDGQGVVTVYHQEQRSYLIASSIYGWALSQEIYSTEALLSNPVWTEASLSARAIARARAAVPDDEQPLYTEFVQPQPAAGPPSALVDLPDVNRSDDRAQMSDRVNDSFMALRQRILDESGRDYLSILGSAWRSMDHTPRPGQSRMSWHVCGRAFDVNQDYYDRDDQLIHLVREDVGNETYWRIYLRATQQDGSMGEPLRTAPWDLKARDEEDSPAAIQGGQLLEEVPSGYYVDFTTLAADYGWERVSAMYRWRSYWPDIEWWHFQKTGDQSWWQCMLEIFVPEEIEDSFGEIPPEELEVLGE